MYAILTSRSGQFRTEPAQGMTVVESYDYLFYGRSRAQFTIVSFEGEQKVRVVDADDPSQVNLVPSKFLEKYPTLEQAREALTRLASFGTMDISLVRRELPGRP